MTSFSHLHADMQSILKKMEANSLRASKHAYWYLDRYSNPVIGWIQWPNTQTILDSINEVVTTAAGFDQFITFSPELPITNFDFSFSLNWGNRFAYISRSLIAFYPSSTRLRCRRISSSDIALRTLGHEVELDSDITYKLEDELSVYSDLPDGSFLACFSEENDIMGIILVHGVTNDLAWFRRLYICPQYRGLMPLKSLITASLNFAFQMGYRRATGLVSERFWRVGLLKSFGFELEAEIRLLKVNRI